MSRVGEIKFVFFCFLIWRASTFFVNYIASLVLPYRVGSDFTLFLLDPKVAKVINNVVIGPLANFDGIHYLSIALNGYTTDARFFPLYPLLVRLITNLVGGKSIEVFFIISILVSNLLFFLSLVFFYKLVKLDYSQKVARLSVIFLLLFPTSFFYGAVYSESLFFLLAVLSFYFAKQEKWFLAILFATALALTRIVGLLIIPALIYEYFRGQNQRHFFKLAIFLTPFISLVGYSVFNYQKWGDWLYFIHNQGELANGRSTSGIIFFGQTIYRYFKIFLDANRSYEWWIALLELGSFVLGAGLIYLIYKKSLIKSYLIYSILLFLLPISTGTFSGLPRYSVVIFPIFIALALVKSKTFRLTYVVISILLSGLLITLFARGYYVS